MLRDKFFICFGEDWGRHPSSSQHLIKEFLKDNKVLWINSISTRSPRLSLYDLNRLFIKLRDWNIQPQQSEFNNLEIMSPLVIPAYHIKAIRGINKFLLSQQIRKRLRKNLSKKPILWLSGPTPVDMVGRLNETLSIYYCGDEFSEYPGVSKEAIINMEKELFSKVDMVIVSSKKLYEAKKMYNKNISIVTHGVDFELFNKDNNVNKPIPEELKNIKRPIIGFYGLIADWIDTELLQYVAQKKPEWSIVLIGKKVVSLSNLEKLSNVHWLGPISYKKLPFYSRHFDVALMLYKAGKWSRFVNPLKMFEYMAAGLSIVSPYVPELEKYNKIIKLASSKEEFLEKINESLQESDKNYLLEGINIAREETWQKKALQVSLSIEETLNKKE